MNISAAQLQQARRLLPKLVTPAVLLIIFIGCYYLCSAVYYFSLAPNVNPSTLKPVRAGRGQQWAWFQAPAKPKPKKQVVTETVTKARLNATLKGIVQLDDGNSVAIIDVGRKQDKSVFKVGDKINNSVTIEAIESRRVLIREQGQLRELVLEDKGIGLEVSEKQASGIASHEAVGKPLTQVANINAPILAGISFVQTDNGDTGMSLGSINPSMLEGTDLQADDVVLSAGGTTVEQILASPMSYQSLMRTDSLDITVMRNGEEAIVNINPRSIAPNIMRMIGQNR